MFENVKPMMDKMYAKKVVFFLPLILLVLIVVWVIGSMTFGTSMGSSGISYSTQGGLKTMELAYDSGNVMYRTGVTAPSVGGVASLPSVAVSQKKVIKNASVDMLVKKVEDTSASIGQIATKYGGDIDNLNVSNGGADTKYGTVTVRVPNDKFDQTIAEIKALAVKINLEVVSNDDVTAQYVDLEARLKSKKAVEGQYVDLLKRATKVEEIVAVHSYLDNVREQIETLQAQMNYLSRQVDMSSITVSMTSETEVKIFGITWRPITVVKQAFRNLLKDLVGIVDDLIYIVFALPGLLIKIALLLLVIWLVVKIWMRIYRRFLKDKLPTAQV
jgi:hypothetical protein